MAFLVCDALVGRGFPNGFLCFVRVLMADHMLMDRFCVFRRCLRDRVRDRHNRLKRVFVMRKMPDGTAQNGSGKAAYNSLAPDRGKKRR